MNGHNRWALVSMAWMLLTLSTSLVSVASDQQPAYIPIEKAVEKAFLWVERIPDYSIRGMRVRFVAKGSELVKGYRGTVPSEVDLNRAYWHVTMDFYKTNSQTMEFQGAMTIDALTGQRVRPVAD